MNESTESKAQDTQPQVNEQRRRLTRGGLAAPVVLGTLLSRPVLGAAPYNCTISGQMSGNVSSHGAPVACNTLGLSPGYWRQDQHFDDWTFSNYFPGSGMISNNFKPIASPTLDGSKQDTEGTLFTAAGFVNVFKVVNTTPTTTTNNGNGNGNGNGNNEAQATYELRADSAASGNATLLQVVAAEGNEGDLVSLGRAAVASLLNAHKFAPDYPLRADQVVAMFNAVAGAGGTYEFNDTTFWNRAQVKAYFESLYGGKG